MAEAGDILVVGGYGVTGRRIAARLAPRFPGQVVIAGRDEARARSCSDELGFGTRGRRLDIDQEDSIQSGLHGVGTVMVCVTQTDRALLRASIARGLAYTDIAPQLSFWQDAEEMDEEARRTGACVLMGAGLSPGISNMMARQLADAVGRVTRIEVAISLSLGDEFGPDSLQYIIRAVARPFSLLESGRVRQALPLTEAKLIEFPAPLGWQRSYVFPWSDVAYYPKTLGARTAVGRLSLEPQWAGRAASLLVRAGAPTWLEGSTFFHWLHRATERLKRFYAGQDRFAVVVTVEGGSRTRKMSLVGSRQADATAVGAAEFASALTNRTVRKPGVWLPEQLVPVDGFFEALASHGWNAVIDESSSDSSRWDVGMRRCAKEVRS